MMTFVVGEDAADVEALLKRVAAADGMSPDEYREKRARAFIGTAAGAVELINRYAEIGVTQIQTTFPFGEEIRSMKIFAEEIIPRV